MLTLIEELAARFADGASDRDRDRRLPHAELDELSTTGFFGLTVPREFGGPDADVPTVTEAFRLLSAADPSIGQIPQSHFVFMEALRLAASGEQKERFFAEALAGKRFANAQSERGTRTITEDRTTLTRQNENTFILDGEKFYATGSLFADWLVVRAVVAGGSKALAYLPAGTEGIEIRDDWDALGQKTTGSGTVVLRQVLVPAGSVVPYSQIFEKPTAYGSFAQVMHAAIDAGVARAALTEAPTPPRPDLRACLMPVDESARGVDPRGPGGWVIAALGLMPLGLFVVFLLFVGGALTPDSPDEVAAFTSASNPWSWALGVSAVAIPAGAVVALLLRLTPRPGRAVNTCAQLSTAVTLTWLAYLATGLL